MKRLIYFVVIIFTLLISCSDGSKNAPKAVKGVLDLRNWDFENDGILKLDGEWEFCWQRFLTDDKFDSIENKKYVEVPSIWSNYKMNNENLPDRGYASYRLKVIGIEKNKNYSFKILPLGTAYKLFVDGKLFGKNGITGINENESKPQFKSQILYINPKNDTINLTLWVSNYHYRKGGFWTSMRFGLTENIASFRDTTLALELLQVGGCIFLALYLLILFFHRNKEIPTLFTALCLIALILRILSTGEYFIVNIFEDIGWKWVIKSELTSLNIALTLYIAIFYSLFKDEVNLKIFTIIITMFSLISLFNFLGDPYLISFTVIVSQIILVISQIYIMIVLIIAFLHKRTGAKVILFGYSIALLTMINDLLYINGIIITYYLSTYAFLLITLCYSYVLSKKFANEFNRIQNFSHELTKEVEDKTKDLRAEKEKSDQLLLNVLPEQIANRLKTGETPIADHFDEASVIFIDIADFTKMSAKSTPQKMVNMLNEIFSIFDKISAKYGLEKIKTIGDCYMAAAGIPVPREDHAQAIALMALEVMETMKGYTYSSDEFKSSDESYIINFRIGLDCGPIVAGVIGEQKFIYDLWGDMVNTASRMESNGVVGKIQCTGRFKEKIEQIPLNTPLSKVESVAGGLIPFSMDESSELHSLEKGGQCGFYFEDRGEIEIKGKGIMKTWFIRKYN